MKIYISLCLFSISFCTMHTLFIPPFSFSYNSTQKNQKDLWMWSLPQDWRTLWWVCYDDVRDEGTTVGFGWEVCYRDAPHLKRKSSVQRITELSRELALGRFSKKKKKKIRNIKRNLTQEYCQNMFEMREKREVYGWHAIL